MGDCPTEPLRPQFDRRLRLRFFGAMVTSDAGLLAFRELDDALDLSRTAAGQLQDSRTGQNTQHTATALLRQAIYSRLAGYEDLNDAERLRVDPTMRTVVGGRARDHTAASTSEIARFETEALSSPANLKRLMDLSGRWARLAAPAGVEPGRGRLVGDLGPRGGAGQGPRLTQSNSIGFGGRQTAESPRVRRPRTIPKMRWAARMTATKTAPT